jgi:hypothetical protein
MCDRNETLRARLLEHGCEDEYKILEACLQKNNRDWRPCQESMYAFRECYDIVQKKLRAQERESQGITGPTTTEAATIPDATATS